MTERSQLVPRRILLVHNHYLQPGGEDTVVEAEKQLLESKGHEVELLTEQNVDLAQAGLGARLRGAAGTVYSRAGRARVDEAIRRFRPEVAHVHNTFQRLSPAVYDACWAHRLPVVQTLHNYRLLCVNGLLYRDGHTCEDCVGKLLAWPGVVHACYRGSRAASATVAAMLLAHRLRQTYAGRITRYIALTEFARQKFVAGGLPPAHMVVKPNMVYPSPTLGTGAGGYALFVGRLSAEKGVGTLLDAWRQIGARLPLQIVGDGPLAGQVATACRQQAGLSWLGRRPRAEVFDLMRAAAVLVFPSVWYEMFSMTAIEALAVGLPVIASNLGSMTEIVRHQHNGLHFRPGDAGDLVAQVDWLLAHPVERQRMRAAARAEFEQKYTADRNYELLLAIYRDALAAYNRPA